jgi:hypothetical protein
MSTDIVGSTRHDRQQRLNPRPQLAGDDPGRLLPLPHITASPSKIDDIARAALILTHFGHGYIT